MLSPADSETAHATTKRWSRRIRADMHDAMPTTSHSSLYRRHHWDAPRGFPSAISTSCPTRCNWAFELGPRSDDVYLHVAPMFHSADLLATPYFISGAAHVYLPKFSPTSVLQTYPVLRCNRRLDDTDDADHDHAGPDFESYDYPASGRSSTARRRCRLNGSRRCLQRSKASKRCRPTV